MIPLTINRKPYMASPMTPSHLTLSDLERSTSILSGRRGICYTYICQYCITTIIYMSQKGLIQAGGVSRCPSGLSCFNAYDFNWQNAVVFAIQDIALSCRIQIERYLLNYLCYQDHVSDASVNSALIITDLLSSSKIGLSYVRAIFVKCIQQFCAKLLALILICINSVSFNVPFIRHC